LSTHLLFMWYHYQMITVQSCEKAVSGVKLTREFKPHNQTPSSWVLKNPFIPSLHINKHRKQPFKSPP
jgi:hypothetical protein